MQNDMRYTQKIQISIKQLRSRPMKKVKNSIKIAALVLALTMVACIFASCGPKTVMTLTVDGKTYTANETEYSTFMKISKMNFYLSNGYSTQLDSIIWNITAHEDETFDDHYTEDVRNLVKTTVVEKYLFEKYGLKLSDETLAGFKSGVKTLNTNYGGRGAYKRYFGYTAQNYYDYYQTALEKSEMIIDYLYKGDNAIDPVTDADLEKYYNEKYSGYMFIYLDMNNAIEKDDDGNYIGLDSSDNKYMLKRIDGEDGAVMFENIGRVDGKEADLDKVEIVSFSTVELDEDGVSDKATLPEKIIHELDEYDGDFKALALEYSDDYNTYRFENGVLISDSGYIVNNDSVMDAVRALEVGEHTEAIAVSDGQYYYIVKRIELVKDGYKSAEYEDLFEGFEDTVIYDKYDKVIDEYANKIVVDEEIVSKYKMSTTYLTEYVDYYRQYISQASN